MQNLWKDFRHGLRSIANRPGFAAAALLSLALGIGLNTAVFSVINAVFLAPLPVQEQDRLVSIFCADQKTHSLRLSFYPISWLNFRDLRDNSRSFEGLVAYAPMPLRLDSGDQPLQIDGLIATGNYFDVLGVRAALGRTFLPEEDQTPGSHPVVVLSHGLWEREFGSDPGLIGRQIRLNNREFTVIGVAPQGFQGVETFRTVDFWVPMMMHEQIFSYEDFFWHRRWLLFSVFGRLRPGVTLEQSHEELANVARHLQEQYPVENKGRSFSSIPVNQASIDPNYRGSFVTAGGMLMGVVMLVLLIACFNVANLLLARTLGRSREIAVRLALGASRRALIQQLLVESLLLSLGGGLLGLLLASWCRSLLWRFRPAGLPEEALALTFDVRVLLFALGLSLLTGILFGLAPALQSTNLDLIVSLKDRTGDPSSSTRRLKPRDLLVAVQIAVTLVALTIAGLFLRSLNKVRSEDPVLDIDRLVSASLDLKAAGYDEARARVFHRQVVERIGNLPGVATASVSENPLMDPNELLRTPIPEGRDESDERGNMHVGTNAAGPGYFATTGIDIVRGREFTDADRQDGIPVAIVNEDAAQRFWPAEDALGKRFHFNSDTQLIQIVGIAKTAKYNSLDEPRRPFIYLPLAQRYSGEIALIVRTQGEPARSLGTIRKELQAMDRSLNVVDLRTASQILDETLWSARMTAVLLLAFGLLALTLAAIGIYGIISYSVSLRTREIGVRMALGAQRGMVLKLILQHGLLITAAGIGVGLLLNAALTGLLRRLLYGISAYDPLSVAGAVVLLVAVVLASCLWPAVRAMGIHPTIALRRQE